MTWAAAIDRSTRTSVNVRTPVARIRSACPARDMRRSGHCPSGSRSPNHEDPEIDRVLFENERFATIEKFFGPGARIARSTDPRR